MRDLATWQVNGIPGTDAIFEGMVERQEVKPGSIRPPRTATSMTACGAYRIVTIRASRVYRGPSQEHFTVLTGMGMGDCGFDFETGKEYLIYAEMIEGGSFFTSICTGTALLEHAGPALRLLRGEPPAVMDLLDIQSYYARLFPQWTGTVCGHISKPDGTPLGGAIVELWQLREEPLLSNTESDPNLSRPDGSFRIEARPGRYLLTAEENDYDAGTRLMGFYPGVMKHSQATAIEVRAGSAIPDLRFTLFKELLCTVRVSVIMADGSPLPWKNPWEHLSVAIDSPDRDPLAYHLDNGVGEDGSSTFGLVPVGHYTVKCYLHPSLQELEGKQPAADLSRWQGGKQEVDIAGDSEFVLKLSPVR
jgi:hypothetical protein